MHRTGTAGIIAGGLWIALAAGVVFGLTFGFYHAASPRFYVASWWLALRGRTPWRLASFLDAAHKKQVLRQAGPAYQFRHELLRKHLAPEEPEARGARRQSS